MKNNLKPAQKSSTYCAQKEVKATVTSIFETIKDPQEGRMTVGRWLKAAGCGCANTSHRADARPCCPPHADGHALCRVRSRAMTITLILNTGIS